MSKKTVGNKIYTSMQSSGLMPKVRGMAYTAKSQILLVLMQSFLFMYSAQAYIQTLSASSQLLISKII